MAIERIAAAYEKGGVSGLSTGFLELDQLLGGLQPSDLIIMAGRPSMGKTALALGLAFHIAKQIEDGEVSVYSLEMSASQLLMRQLGIDTAFPPTGSAAAISKRRIWNGFFGRKARMMPCRSTSTRQGA